MKRVRASKRSDGVAEQRRDLSAAKVSKRSGVLANGVSQGSEGEQSESSGEAVKPNSENSVKSRRQVDDFEIPSRIFILRPVDVADGMGSDERSPNGKSALVEAFASFGGDALRDVWLFDQSSYESLYLRDDVGEKIADVDVATFVDNERYGYVTRETYADLHYTSYEYTVRGFGEYEQFRTFLAEDDRKIGLFASFDRRPGGYNFGDLQTSVDGLLEEYPTATFVPE